MISHDDKEANDRVMTLYFVTFPDKIIDEMIDIEHLATWIEENTDYECKNCGYTFSECGCETFDPRA